MSCASCKRVSVLFLQGALCVRQCSHKGFRAPQRQDMDYGLNSGTGNIQGII